MDTIESTAGVVHHLVREDICGRRYEKDDDGAHRDILRGQSEIREQVSETGWRVDANVNLAAADLKTNMCMDGRANDKQFSDTNQNIYRSQSDLAAMLHRNELQSQTQFADLKVQNLETRYENYKSQSEYAWKLEKQLMENAYRAEKDADRLHRHIERNDDKLHAHIERNDDRLHVHIEKKTDEILNAQHADVFSRVKDERDALRLAGVVSALNKDIDCRISGLEAAIKHLTCALLPS